jgi:peptidase E
MKFYVSSYRIPTPSDYEMRRSSFEKVIKELLDAGVVHGGDSAGALVTGQSIAGVESVDRPESAEDYINLSST